MPEGVTMDDARITPELNHVCALNHALARSIFSNAFDWLRSVAISFVSLLLSASVRLVVMMSAVTTTLPGCIPVTAAETPHAWSVLPA